MSGPHLFESEFPDDDGRPDPALTEALSGYARGAHGEYAVLPSLAAARLLLPVVPVPADAVDGTDTANGAGGACGAGGGNAVPSGAARGICGTEVERVTHGRGAHGRGAHGRGAHGRGEMALPSLIGADGRRGVLAFTSAAAMARWRDDARPIPVRTARACQAAIAEGADALVVDVAGPVPFAVDGYRLRVLGEGGPVPAAHEDPDVLAAVKEAFAGEDGVRGIRVGPGDRAELSVRCAVGPHQDERATARRVADRLTRTLHGRVVGGIELGVTRARAAGSDTGAAADRTGLQAS